VRDPITGQFDPSALPALLVNRLGGHNVVSVKRVFWDFEAVGGFNRKWRIEVPQALAVQAGSILVLKALREIPALRLREIEHAGVGERQVEGFGRLVFLRHSPSLSVRIQTTERPIDKTDPPAVQPPATVRFLQQRMLDDAFSRLLDRKVKAIVGEPNGNEIPSASLLGRLRIPLRSGDPMAGLQRLQQWLREPNAMDRTTLKEEAQKKLRECVLANGSSLREWLIQAATADAGAKSATRELPLRYQISRSNNLIEGIASERGAYYAVQLIDAVLAGLARLAHIREGERSR